MHTLYNYPDVRGMPIFSHYLNAQVGKQAHQHQICISFYFLFSAALFQEICH